MNVEVPPEVLVFMDVDQTKCCVITVKISPKFFLPCRSGGENGSLVSLLALYADNTPLFQKRLAPVFASYPSGLEVLDQLVPRPAIKPEQGGCAWWEPAYDFQALLGPQSSTIYDTRSEECYDSRPGDAGDTTPSELRKIVDALEKLVWVESSNVPETTNIGGTTKKEEDNTKKSTAEDNTKNTDLIKTRGDTTSIVPGERRGGGKKPVQILDQMREKKSASCFQTLALWSFFVCERRAPSPKPFLKLVDPCESDATLPLPGPVAPYGSGLELVGWCSFFRLIFCGLLGSFWKGRVR